jgi:hypothetical protein
MSTNVIQVPNKFTPRPYQLKLFQAMDGVAGKPETRMKRAFLRWHRRAGKDKACFCYMLKEAATCPGNYFYVFPFASDARRALWENVDKDGFKLLDHMPAELIDRKNNQDMLMQLTNGSTIRVIGLDNNPDGIRGTAIRGIVFSEYAFQDPAPYRNCLPAVKEADGWIIVNSTPNGRNHFYDMYLMAEQSKNWYSSTLQTMWPDRDDYSALVSPKDLKMYIEEEGATEDDAEREYGVSFSTGMKGAFYADQVEKARDQGRVGSYPIDDHRYVDTFWDLGVDDSTAIWFRQIDGGRVIWVDYFEDSGKDLAFYVDILKQKGYNYRTHYLPHDGANRTIQTRFRTDEIFRMICKEAKVSDDVCIAPKLRVQDGINGVRARFSRYFFNEGTCADGLEKLSLYHRRYDKKRQVFLKEPVHDWTSHCADAIRTEAAAEEYPDDNPLFVDKPRIVSNYDPYSS